MGGTHYVTFIINEGFKFGDVLMICQTGKLKFPPNFPAVRYMESHLFTIMSGRWKHTYSVLALFREADGCTRNDSQMSLVQICSTYQMKYLTIYSLQIGAEMGTQNRGRRLEQLVKTLASLLATSKLVKKATLFVPNMVHYHHLHSKPQVHNRINTSAHVALKSLKGFALQQFNNLGR